MNKKAQTSLLQKIIIMIIVVSIAIAMIYPQVKKTTKELDKEQECKNTPIMTAECVSKDDVKNYDSDWEMKTSYSCPEEKVCMVKMVLEPS